MLADNRIIFPKRELFGLGPGILFRHIVKAGIGRADELDLDGCWLCHGANLYLLKMTDVRAVARKRGPLLETHAFVKHWPEIEDSNELVTMFRHIASGARGE
jgi:hypothetical protein